jgi:outer membrane lipoprotein-sorting protein
MRASAKWSALAALGLAWAVHAQAQAPARTADDVIEKHLAALGGRDALAKLETRISKGTVSVSLQGTDISGPIEIYNKAPNKMRTHFELDLSSFGGDNVVVDQRCDGKTAFISHSMQGDREITGSQLQGMVNAQFPSPLMVYKQTGATVQLTGTDTIGGRQVYVLRYTPKTGPATRQYIDAETYLSLRAVTTLDAPELGGAAEQTTDVSDFRDVDGIKVPFTLHIVNPAQTVTITLASVEHNTPIDEAMFTRPVAK